MEQDAVLGDLELPLKSRVAGERGVVKGELSITAFASELAITGAEAASASLFLVSDYVFDSTLAGLAAGITLGLILVLWYGLPIWIRLNR